MKIFELAAKLKVIYDKHGDIEVMFAAPNNDTDPYVVGKIMVETVEDDEDYPEEYAMPKGFKFVSIEC